MDVFLLILAGVITGCINVMAGGGSMFSLPALMFLGIPGPIANATNRIGGMAQNITSVITFYRKGFSNFRLSLSLAFCSLPGVVIGAFIASKIKAENFDIVLVIILFAMVLSLFMDRSSKAINDTEPKPISKKHKLAAHFGMVIAGFWGGFIQMGVAFIILPILQRGLGVDLIHANMHKVFIVLLMGIISLLVFASQIEVEWMAGLYLAFGAMIGAYIGTNLQIKRGPEFVRWMLITVAVIFTIRLIMGRL